MEPMIRRTAEREQTIASPSKGKESKTEGFHQLFEAKPGNFGDLLRIGFDKTHLEDQGYVCGRIYNLFTGR